jgi:uncharacterized protein
MRGWGRGVIVALAVVTVALAGGARADDFPPPSGFVVDVPRVLRPETVSQLTSELTALRDSTGHEIAVAIVQSLGGRTIEDYGQELFNRWRVGRAGFNDGVLLVVAIDDHKVRLQIGDGLRDPLSDERAAVIIDRDVVPRFRAGDFDGGVGAGVESVRAALGNSSSEPVSGTSAPPETAPGPVRVPVPVGPVHPYVPVVDNRPSFPGSGGSGAGALFALVAVIGIGGAIAAAVFRGGFGMSSRCPGCGGPLSYGRWGGLYYDTCGACGFRRHRSRGWGSGFGSGWGSSGWGGGGGGSSFGGFSGGGSSGGGASGSFGGGGGGGGGSFSGGSSSGGGASGSW